MELPTINEPLHGLGVNVLICSCPYKDADILEQFFSVYICMRNMQIFDVDHV